MIPTNDDSAAEFGTDIQGDNTHTVDDQIQEITTKCPEESDSLLHSQG